LGKTRKDTKKWMARDVGWLTWSRNSSSELESGEEANPSRECNCSRRHKCFCFTKKSTRL